MPDRGPCPRTITIRLVNGTITAAPPTATIDRGCQILQFNFVHDQSGTFNDPPIRFPWPVPPNVPPPPCGVFTQWPPQATLVKTGPMQWEANARDPRPPGATDPVCYKYDVLWSGGVFDPDIKNDPYPPSSGHGDDEDDDDQGGGGGHAGGGQGAPAKDPE